MVNVLKLYEKDEIKISSKLQNIRKWGEKMQTFKPMILTDLKNYSAKKLSKDIISGIIVAVIALPLSIALAIASGVAPEAGIYTAVVAGFITSLLGGSSVQIAGPTAAFATIVAGIVAQKGMQGLMLATVLAGIILIIMGIFKLGNLIKFIPFSITTGFTAGIAVTLVIGQLKHFAGVSYMYGENPIETFEKLGAFCSNISTVNFEALAVGAVCLLILFVLPRFFDKIPASLVAVVAGTFMVMGLNMNVNTIGDLYDVSCGTLHFQMPEFSFGMIADAIPDAITIAVLAGIESLLSCVVADGMINGKHRPNTELIAQGAANIGSALYGGIPATGAIARTAANVKNGGRTPVAGIVHSLVLFAVLAALMKYASYIPMPAIAAILINVAYNMCGHKTFVKFVKKSPKSDIIVLISTFVLTVAFDLVVAIDFGVIAACVLFMKRMSDESGVEGWKYSQKNDSDKTLMNVPEYISVYEFNGPMFFAVAGQISNVTVKEGITCIIIRMRGVMSLDADALRGIEELTGKCRSQGAEIVLSHVNAQPMKAMRKYGLVDIIGEENIMPDINSAMERAQAFKPQMAEKE